MKDLLDAFYAVISLLGFWVGFFFVAWTISKICRTVSNFLETQKYKAKLRKISPKIESIDTERLSSRLSSTNESYLKLMDQIQQRYGIAEEPWKNACTYKEDALLQVFESWGNAKLRRKTANR